MKQRQEKNDLFDQQVNFLKKIPFFQDFDDHELKQLLAVSRWLKVPPNTQIIKENSREKVFYILVKGTVSVFLTKENNETVELTSLATGATFGEMALVGETRRTAGVKTSEECYILMVEPDILNQASVFLQLKFYRRFCEILVSRLIAANKRMSTLSAALAETEPEDETGAARREQPPPAQQQSPPAGQQPNAPKAMPKRPQELTRSPEGANHLPPGGELPPPPQPRTVAKGKMQRSIQGHIDLPVNPSVAARLSSFLVGDCEDTRRFADLISTDPMLAAKVIQQANSSFYRRTMTVNSVPHAMVTMGIKNLQEIVAAEILKLENEKEPFGGFSQLADAFWLHSVAVGRIAEILRDALRINLAEDIYLAGLFHDLGQLALDRQNPNFYPQLLRPDFVNKGLCQAEQEFVGIDHGQAGYWLGEKMALPKSYLDVMLYHHAPEKARDNILLVALIHLADLFAKQRGLIMGRDNSPSPPVASSFGWVLLQEQHPPFIEVNIDNFISSFDEELDRMWGDISSLLAI